MINRKSIVNSPDDRLRQFNRMPIPNLNINHQSSTLTHKHTHRGQIGTALLCQGAFIQPGRNNMIHLNNRRVQCPTGFRG